MSFRPALVIPIYNHGDAIGAAVDRLARFGVPIYIVDDGSDAATQAVLAELAACQPLVVLARLPQNAGKGAAVMAGMRNAFADGCTHALQIDADGQHDTNDVLRFFKRAGQRPDAIIAGKPIYDASVPKARLYGRLITHFWVWVETLSFAIGDSMCGYRLYPLAPTIRLIDRTKIPTRMDFDTEIIVRLAWAGVPVDNLTTRVTYPEGGISHFDMRRDNLRISWMHTRLCAGMLLRLPLLLWRKLRPARDEAHWSRQQERGSGLGMRILVAAYRLLGDPLARAMLRPIVAWHLLASASARNASLDYLQRLHRFTGGQSPRPNWRNAWRHLLAFAESALDKLGGWTGRIAQSDVDFPNRPEFFRLLSGQRGLVLLGAHLGNLEMMRAIAVGNNLAVINAVVYSEHAQRFAGSLAAANDSFRINLIPIDKLGPDTAIVLRDKIDRGEVLVIVGDRTPPAENGRVVEIDFLGAPASFAQGPYILAALLECPVHLFFCLREADGYRVHFEPFAERIVLPRGERQQAITAYARRYAARLEALCARAPLQWFNFFDFWRRPASSQQR
ncbi:MAG: glycosyltransferase family 2 protein [Betaproteobacteria bacterium]